MVIGRLQSIKLWNERVVEWLNEWRNSKMFANVKNEKLNKGETRKKNRIKWACWHEHQHQYNTVFVVNKFQYSLYEYT